MNHVLALVERLTDEGDGASPQLLVRAEQRSVEAEHEHPVIAGGIIQGGPPGLTWASGEAGACRILT